MTPPRYEHHDTVRKFRGKPSTPTPLPSYLPFSVDPLHVPEEDPDSPFYEIREEMERRLAVKPGLSSGVHVWLIAAALLVAGVMALWWWFG